MRFMMATVGTTREAIPCYKSINQGYYWFKMFSDAKKYVKRCPQLPKIRSFKQANYEPLYITESLVLYAMATECSGPTSPSTTSVPIPAGRSRLLHQVDRSCASLRSHWTTCDQVPMAESCMSFWPTTHHHLRQRDELRQQGSGYFMYQVQDRPPVFYTILFTGQWSSRDKQSHHS